MPLVKVLPHEEICPQGVEFEAVPGDNLARALLAHGVAIEHACEFSCACSTCHVDNELDHLDAAWGAGLYSRLSCQTTVGEEDITIEIPKYSRNHAKEH